MLLRAWSRRKDKEVEVVVEEEKEKVDSGRT